MSKCTNESIGAMLHAWELDLLSDDDKLKFEQHLFECAGCFESARKHDDAMAGIRSNEMLRSRVREYAEAATQEEVTSEPWYVRVMRSPVYRYATAAVIVLALVVPALYHRLKIRSGQETVQVVRLMPTRSALGSTIYLDRGTRARLEIGVPEIAQALTYTVTVSPVGSDRVSWRDRVQFNANGESVVTLPLSDLKPGNYELRIENPGPLGEKIFRVYYFAVRQGARQP